MNSAHTHSRCRTASTNIQIWKPNTSSVQGFSRKYSRDSRLVNSRASMSQRLIRQAGNSKSKIPHHFFCNLWPILLLYGVKAKNCLWITSESALSAGRRCRPIRPRDFPQSITLNPATGARPLQPALLPKISDTMQYAQEEAIDYGKMKH